MACVHRCDWALTLLGKYFAEVRLLQRPIKVQLLSAPAYTRLPRPSKQDHSCSCIWEGQWPPRAPCGCLWWRKLDHRHCVIARESSLTKLIPRMHPNGNIAEFLCAAGLARSST